jgi:hypothetical protein
MSGSREQALVNTQVGTYGTEGEQLDWSYYDTIQVAVATLTHRLFTNPLGSAGKMLDETNLTLAGQIPQGQLLDVRAIKVFYAGSTVKATANVLPLYTLLARTVVSIKLANKETMGQWTLQELLGAATLISLTPTAAGDNIPIIQPRFHGIFPMNKKLILAALTPFEVTLTHSVAPDASLANDRIKISLAGILTRVS